MSCIKPAKNKNHFQTKEIRAKKRIRIVDVDGCCVSENGFKNKKIMSICNKENM